MWRGGIGKVESIWGDLRAQGRMDGTIGGKWVKFVQVVYLDADIFLFSCPKEAFSHEQFSLGEDRSYPYATKWQRTSRGTMKRELYDYQT
eukprot:748382-Hanusia_phi.AAC.8